MKKISIIFTCSIVFAALFIFVFGAQAYQFYSEDIGTTGGCAQCHGAFSSGVPYTSLVDGVSWGVDLHTGHLTGTNIVEVAGCDSCHSGNGTTGNQVNIGHSAGGSSYPIGIFSCTGCHGRVWDDNEVNQNGHGMGAGLRQHHFNASTIDCLTCHADADPAAFTPVREDAWPEYYWDVPTADYLPMDPCNKGGIIDGVEHIVGSPRGLDNDGDLIYDVAENECQDGTCGNGIVDAGEACDGGFFNGKNECGCQTDCTYTSAGTPCTDDGEYCNGEEICNGTGNCVTGPPLYTDRGSCNADPNCEWIGNPKSGTCQDIVVCVPNEAPETTCTDGIDNDCDGLTDCADTDDCGGDPACQGGSCDTYTDKGTCNDDPNCEWAGSPQNGTCQDAVACVPDETPEATCTDGVDNDCDGMTDCADTDDCGADPACQGGSCDTYLDKVSCQNNGCTWSNKDKVCM